MKKPDFLQALFIQTKNFLSVKATLTLRAPRSNSPLPRFPLLDIPLLKRERFTLKICLKDKDNNKISEHYFDTDSFGEALFRLPLNREQIVHSLDAFECSFIEGEEHFLGNFTPLKVASPSKVVISDFDKTLVSTSYGNVIDIITSLINPIEYFPNIESGIELLKSYIEKGHLPFVLSASPHFYETTIQDWLSKQDLKTCGIFLKDYRQSFSLSDGLLSFKDLWNQGLYKLHHLIELLILCDLPDEIILLGDDYESDPLIYATLAQILHDEKELGPYRLWQKLIEQRRFRLSQNQKARLLSKIYELSSLLYDRKLQKKPLCRLKVHIRKTGTNKKIPEGVIQNLTERTELSFF